MLDSSTDEIDELEAPALRVLQRALDPQESDPSRVSLVAALYVLEGQGPGTQDPGTEGGIDLEGIDEQLAHLGSDSDKNR